MNPFQSSCGCTCSAGPKLIFSCSGAADVGELADQTARTLTRNGDGKMFCLAGIGGRVSGILKSTEAAASILAIDGCALDCSKKSLEEAGFTRINHLRLTDLGFEKGNAEVNSDSIALIVDKAKIFLAE
ncbi:MAG: putative zinc-binding protein [Desulfobulbus sp.]